MPWQSLRSFQASLNWFLAEDSVSEQDVDEAKLTVFKEIDAPVDLAFEGMEQFHSGVTHAMLQERRKAFLAVTLAQLKDLVRGSALRLSFRSVVIGGEGTESMADKQQEWRVVSPSLQSFAA